MQFRASHRYAHISPSKVKLVLDLVRGKHINKALHILRGTSARSGAVVDKVLRSTMANADESLEADMESLRVERAWVNGGPVRRRLRARARGRTGTELRRTSHVNIVLDDGQQREE